ncbi:hypothetical protein F5Y18DRAFT_413237 [Xylariaceae sp. FL1019]|nr:hypothetical protein F5Y18DRAFT_413237 [Xylariaceae sp. FL1019]
MFNLQVTNSFSPMAIQSPPGSSETQTFDGLASQGTSLFGGSIAQPPQKQTSPPPPPQPRPPPPPIEYVIIDPNGDLYLQVEDGEGDTSTEAMEFLVNAQTLAKSAKYWEILLFGGFSESKHRQEKETKWRVKLFEVNPSAMRCLLEMVHGQYHKKTIGDRLLYDLCVLTDKYDMTHVLRPWSRGRSRPTHSMDPDWQRRFWIAWVLGDLMLCVEIARNVASDFTPMQIQTRSFGPGGCETETPVWIMEPHGVYEQIEEIRLDAVTRILKHLSSMIQPWITKDATCAPSSSDGGCQALMLGTAIQSLNRLGLWPIPEPRAIESSVADLVDKLGEFECKGTCHIHCPSTDHHPYPSLVLNFRHRLRMVLDFMPSPLKNTQIRVLVSRGSESGLHY